MLTLQDVEIKYPDQTKAIDGISFTLGKGDNIALIGENGAGKTSLLLAIMGILELSGGTVEINGIKLTKKSVHEVRKQIGLVFQNPDDQLFMPLVGEDVAFGCRNAGLSEVEIEKRVAETLAELQIGHLHPRSSLKLSGGEKRMAAVATVLAMKPEVLLFDEPTAFLDPKAKRMLAQALLRLPHPKIIATHDMDFAGQVCNRVIILKQGRIAASGAAALLNDRQRMEEWGL